MRAWMIGVLMLVLVACGGGGGDDESGGKDTTPPPEDTVKTDVAVDTPQDTPQPEDTVQVDTGPEAFSTGISAKGYGEYCTSFADCQDYGLSCFIAGMDDIYPICSKKCETNLDCPEYFVCSYKTGWEEPAHICMEARYCDECQDDIQCMLPGMACIEDEAGGRFCSELCTPGVNSCEAGSQCRYQPDRDEWYCVPHYGTCVGDGLQCHPCDIEAHCQAPDHHCLTMTYSKEKYCAKECSDDLPCADGYGCAKVAEDIYMCIPAENNQLTLTCTPHKQNFCQACKKDWDCAEGLGCFHDATGAGGFCSHECVEHTDCPDSTQCTGWYDTYDGHLIGFACSPMGDFTCERFLENQLEATAE